MVRQPTFFFPSRLFAAIRSHGAVLLVSFQALELFFSGTRLVYATGVESAHDDRKAELVRVVAQRRPQQP